MARSLNSREILREAIKAFTRQTGVETTAPPLSPGQTEGHLHLWRDGETWDFHAVLKGWLNPQHIELLRLAPWKDRTILITRYVNPPQSEILRSLNIPYIDAAGNCSINLPGLHLLVTGRPKVAPTTPERKWDFYRPAELRALFSLLSVEGLATKTHEEIRQTTGVSIGTINHLMQSLAEEGFLVKLPGEDRGKLPAERRAVQRRGRRTEPRKLTRQRELIDRWTAAYPHGLRQKLLLGTFTARGKQLWERTDPTAFNAQWGGETAAMLLTHSPMPQRVTLYTNAAPQELISQLGLEQQAGGEAEILRRFWNFPGGVEPNTVPPLLVYADLLATHDDRLAGVARTIYENHILPHLQEE